MIQASQLLTIVCPMYNEEDGAKAFYERATTAMQDLPAPLEYELLFVNDGSGDGTLPLLREIAAHDDHVVVLSLSRNFGHQLAITAGIDHARGDAVVVIDSDLQDPPEVIKEMVAKWQEGYEVVYGQRTARPGESAFKRSTASMFYRLLNRMSDVELPLDVGDFRLMDRKVVDALTHMREENRYIRGLVAWAGFRQVALPYARDERYAGETKYPLRKMLHFAADGIASFSTIPLRLAVQLGTLVTAGSFLGVLYVLFSAIFHPNRQLPGYASMMVVILFLGGVQLLTIGILGQYLGRTYAQTRGRPLYLIAERVGSGLRQSEIA